MLDDAIATTYFLIASIIIGSIVHGIISLIGRKNVK